MWFHSLPNNVILDLSKFKAFADDKKMVTQKLKFMLGQEQKTLWEKEKILVIGIFSCTHNVFKKLSFHEVLPVRIVW